MKILRITSAHVIMAVTLLAVLETKGLGQTWMQFTHPNNRHLDVINPDVYIGIPELLQNSSDKTVTIPVLVVLMEFSDVTHRAVHTVAFWEDLVFGPRAGVRPSVAEIYRENSNGRLLLVPAIDGDVHDGSQDGIVGWIATTQSSTELTDTDKKRAEGIRVADPLFDYTFYDDNLDRLITSDELLILTVFADNAPTGATEDQHTHLVGHGVLPGHVGRPGGNARRTDPPYVYVEDPIPYGEPIWPLTASAEVYQLISGVGEIAHVGVVAHEIGHSLLGLGDLYIDGGMRSDPTFKQVIGGYFFKNYWYPPPPRDYSMMDTYNLDYTPHLDPWAKIHLGFVKPLVVTCDSSYMLYDTETERNFSLQAAQPEAVIIYDPLRTDPYNEYFILENRNGALLPDQGLAVWIINENVWLINDNEDKLRKAIRLIRRGGYWADDINMSDALWDGVSDVDGYDFTPTSMPRNTNWTDGSKSYIEIYDISEAGSVMTFKVRMPPIFVNSAAFPLFENGSQTLPFNEVGEAIAAIPEAPRTIRIAGGYYPEDLVIDTPCTLGVWGNGDVVIGK